MEILFSQISNDQLNKTDPYDCFCAQGSQIIVKNHIKSQLIECIIVNRITKHSKAAINGYSACLQFFFLLQVNLRVCPFLKFLVLVYYYEGMHILTLLFKEETNPVYSSDLRLHTIEKHYNSFLLVYFYLKA